MIKIGFNCAADGLASKFSNLSDTPQTAVTLGLSCSDHELHLLVSDDVLSMV